MPEWLIERGIGETRAALVEDGEIIEARIELDGITPAGSIVAARLASIGTDGRNAVAIGEGGDRISAAARRARASPQGATLTIEVTREAIPGTEPWKRPLARIADRSLAAAALADGRDLTFPAPVDDVGDAGWDDLIDQARTGIVRVRRRRASHFADAGDDPDRRRRLSRARRARGDRRRPSRAAIRRLDIGGSIGIDLPTAGEQGGAPVGGRGDRCHLPQPFERTAVNGFGFVQIVRPRRRASLIELAQDRPAFEARALLRRAALGGAGAKRLVAHPAVIAVLETQPGWLAALARQIGGAVELRADAALPMSGGYAENALTSRRAAPCAASPRRPITRPSAAPAARTATC